MKLYTQGHLLNTELAQYAFPLDDRGTIVGHVYCSQRGIWYVHTSKIASIKSPVEILSAYESYLTPDQQEILVKSSGLSWE